MFSQNGYKYGSSGDTYKAIRMATDTKLNYAGASNTANKLSLKNVPLEAGSFFEIRRHYFDSADTKDDFVTDISTGYWQGSPFSRSADSGNGGACHWPVSTTGRYDIYVNSSNHLHVVTASQPSQTLYSAKEESPLTNGAKKKNAGPPKKNAPSFSTGGYIYLSYGENYTWWSSDGGWPVAVFTDDTNNYWQIYDKGYNKANGAPGSYADGWSENKVFRFSIPNVNWTITKVIFARMKSGSSLTEYNDVNWGNAWNQTVDITDGSAGQCYYLSGENSGKQTGSWQAPVSLNSSLSSWGSTYFSYTRINSTYWGMLNYTFAANETFKYVLGDNVWRNQIRAQTGENFVDAGGDDHNIKAVEAGEYDIYFRPEDGLIDIQLHSITLDNQSATSAGTTTISPTPGSPMPAITLPSKTGYTFDGYYTAINGEGTKYYNADGSSAADWEISAGTTLYANWTTDTYTITFNRNNNSATGSTASVTATYGSTCTLTNNGFTLSGWHFDGWATSADGAVAYANGATLTVEQVKTIYGTVGKNGAYPLYAVWSETFKVSLKGEGATTESSPTSFSATRNAAMPASAATAPSRTGWAFDGYYDAVGGGGTQYLTSSMASAHTFDKTADTDLYAKWIMTGTITLHPKGGSSGTESISNQVYKADMQSITIPEKEGYTFAGYWTSENDDSGTKYYNNDGSSAAIWEGSGTNTTLYAHWTQKAYTVNKGTSTNGTLTVNSTGSYATNLTISWIPENATGYNYTNLSVNVYGGTSASGALLQTVTSGTSTTFNMSTAKDEDLVTGKYYDNIYITLSYTKTAKTYSVTLADNNTSGTTHSITATYDATMPSKDTSGASLSVPTFSGYTFQGYYSSSGVQYYTSAMASARTWDIDDDVTLYAKWTKTSAIKLDKEGGSGGDSTVAAGQVYGETMTTTSVSTPTLAGYTFQGYYTEKAGEGTQYYGSNGAKTASAWNQAGDVSTLYAKWTVTNTITLNRQSGTGGTGSLPSGQVYGAVMATSSITAPTRTGYTFQGYYSGTNGSGTKYYNANGTRTSEVWNLTGNTDYALYAYWIANDYTVTFDVNEITGSVSATVDPTSTEVSFGSTYGSLPTPTRTGYTFDGWYTSPSGGTLVTSSTIVTTANDHTLYAHWIAKSWDVTLNLGGGTVRDGAATTVHVTYDQAIPASLGDGYYVPYKAGYAFGGYYTQSDGNGTEYYNAFLRKACADNVDLIWHEDGDSLSLTAYWVDLRIDGVIAGDTIYGVFENSNGALTNDKGYLYAWGSDWAYYVEMSAVSPYSNVFTAVVPSSATGALIYRGGDLKMGAVNASNKSGDFKSGSSYVNDSYSTGKQLDNDMVYVRNGSSATWEWNTYVPAPTASGTGVGYYVSPIVDNAGSWSAANKMASEGVPGGAAWLSGYHTLSNDALFQIWCYTAEQEWKIYGTRVISSSVDAGSIDGSSKANMPKIATQGYYDIFLTNEGDTVLGAYASAYHGAQITFTRYQGKDQTVTFQMGVGFSTNFPTIGGITYSGSQNDFLYDKAIEVYAGDVFTISYIHGSGGQDNPYLGISEIDGAAYIERSNNTYVVKSGQGGRYTFYIASSGEKPFVVAQVPTYGNGYYIMPYTSTTSGYVQGRKMATNPNVEGGFFTAYYAAGDKVNYNHVVNSEDDGDADSIQIYIRSYLNAKDRLYKSIAIEKNIAAQVHMNTSTGVITMKGGRYNIRVQDEKVYVSRYTTDDHFSLDPLISKADVEHNYTSIVYEIKFTLNSDVPVEMTASIKNLTVSNQAYIGYKFWAPESQITQYNSEDNDIAPYLVMRERYFDDDVDQKVSVVFSGAGTYYCYIIVDYKDLTGNNNIPTTISDDIEFVLTVKQPEASLLLNVHKEDYAQ